jgi:hypothetical protein
MSDPIQSKTVKSTHLRLATLNGAEMVRPGQAHPTDMLTLTPAQPHVHESATWAPARLILEMQDAQGNAFQLELTIIHPSAHSHCQAQAVEALQVLRPHLFSLGYTLDHVHRLDGVGRELFGFDDQSAGPTTVPGAL